MKRTIAIFLAMLLTFSFAACGDPADNNVSENNSGMIDSEDSRSADPYNSETPSHYSTRDDFRKDMDRAMDDAGDAVKDAGQAVGDAITGQDHNTGAGMTGGR